MSRQQPRWTRRGVRERLWKIVLACVAVSAAPGASFAADAADAARAVNRHYVVNRAPLQQTAFVHLPPGAVRARGWLADQLRVQAEGQTSYLWSAFACASADANPPYHQEGVVALALVLGEHKRLNALTKG